MSIFDKNLLDELVRLAQTTPIQNPMVGTNTNFAGSETAPQITNQNLKDMAKKLITNLHQELAQPKFTAETDNAALRMQAKDLPSLFAFLNTNGIAFNNLKLVLRNMGNQAAMYGKGDGNPELTPENKDKYATYPYENPQYYVYKDGLIAYLRDLQSKKIPLLDVIIPKLIDQANNELGLKMPAVAPKEEVKLGPDVIVDQLPIPFGANNAKQWGTDPSGYLSIKELANFNSPSSFIGSILSKLKPVKGGKSVDLNTIDQGTICEIIGFLHARASNYAKTRSDDPRYAAYLNAVNNIASQYSCPVGGGKEAPGNLKPVSYTTEDGNFTEEGLKAFSSLEYPLDPEEIDFGRIERFINKYIEIMEDSKYKDMSRIQAISESLAKIKNSYPMFTRQNLGRYTAIQLKTDIYNMTKRSSPSNYIDLLQRLLFSVEKMISALASLFRTSSGPWANDIKNKLAVQLQYFTRNQQYIDRWIAEIEQDFNNKKQGQ